MTTIEILLSAVIAMAGSALIMLGVIGCVWMSRRMMPRKGKRKFRVSSAEPPEDRFGQHKFDSGLVVRVWKNAFGGVTHGGVTLLKRTDRGLRQTLLLRQCFDVPRALLFFCNQLERQSWLLDEEREQLPRLRAAMQAADEVLRASRSTGHVNGQKSVNSSDAL